VGSSEHGNEYPVTIKGGYYLV